MCWTTSGRATRPSQQPRHRLRLRPGGPAGPRGLRGRRGSCGRRSRSPATAGRGPAVGEVRGGSFIVGVRRTDGSFHPQPAAETVLREGDCRHGDRDAEDAHPPGAPVQRRRGCRPGRPTTGARAAAAAQLSRRAQAATARRTTRARGRHCSPAFLPDLMRPAPSEGAALARVEHVANRPTEPAQRDEEPLGVGPRAVPRAPAAGRREWGRARAARDQHVQRRANGDVWAAGCAGGGRVLRLDLVGSVGRGLRGTLRGLPAVAQLGMFGLQGAVDRLEDP